MDLDAVHRLAVGLMREHLGDTKHHDYALVYDSAKSRAGGAKFTDRQITLSRPLMALWTEEQVTDTILHEIAHVLAGPGHGHDKVWRYHARQLGARPSSRYDGKAHEGVPYRWSGECGCGKTYHRHRLTARIRAGWCRTCLNPITWTDTTLGTVALPLGEPEPLTVAETADLDALQEAQRIERARRKRAQHEAYWGRMNPEEREAALALRREWARARRERAKGNG